MVKFVADSSCDMLDMPGVCFVSVPLTIHTDNTQWTDDDTMDISDMLDTLSVYKGRSYTSCPGIEAWLTAYEGADTIYVGTLTSGLSGTYNAALAAANIYRQKHPNVQIEVFDTLSTGPELRLLMEKLVELDSEGLSFSEVCKAAHAYMKQTRLFFSFCSLHNFAQNGRVSKAVAAAVGMLGIRIVGTASPQGTIEPITKCRGDKRALNALLSELDTIGFSKGKLRIGHTQNQALADTFASLVRQKYPQADILVYPARGLCSYYGERGAIFFGAETF